VLILMESKCCYDGTHQRRRCLMCFHRYRVSDHHHSRELLPRIRKLLCSYVVASTH